MQDSVIYSQATKILARTLGVTPEEMAAGLVTATLADLPQIIELRAPLLGTPPAWDDTAYLKWRYKLGTADPLKGEFMLLRIAGQIVGGVGIEFADMQVGKTLTGVHIVIDLVVAPRFNGLGIGPWLNMELCRRFETVLVLGSNPESIGTVDRYYRKPRQRSLMVAVLDARPIVAKLLPVPLLHRPATAAANAALALRHAFLFRTRHPEIRIERLSRFDHRERYEVEDSDPTGEIGSLMKTAARLNWRIFSNPRRRYDVWGAFIGPALLGYMVTQAIAADSTHARIPITDWWVVPHAGEEVLRSLFARVLSQAKEANASAVSIDLCDERTEATLLHLGFVDRPDQKRTIGYRTRDTALAQRLGQCRWRIAAIDSDIE